MLFAVIIDGGARIRRGEQLRLIQCASPRAFAHPLCKVGRRLKRIITFPGGEEITQAELEGVLVLVHHLMAKLRWRSFNSARRRIPSRGSHFTSYPIPDKKLYRRWHGILAVNFSPASSHEICALNSIIGKMPMPCPIFAPSGRRNPKAANSPHIRRHHPCSDGGDDTALAKARHLAS